MPEKNDIVIRGKTADLLLWGFRAIVSFTCITAWTLFLDVRDMKMKLASYDRQDASLPGSMSRKDWEYEKRLLLIDHELFKSEISVLRMQVDDLRNR